MQSQQDNDQPAEFSSESHFAVWDYKPGHSQLLLRHPRDFEGRRNENLDVIFVGVFYMRIPPTFSGLKLMVAPPQEAAAVFQEIGWSSENVHRTKGRKRVFQVTSAGRTYYIGAVAWRIDRNTRRFSETS